MKLKEFKTKSGEIILYNGNPNLEMLESLALGAGDIWHSSFEQGYKNTFQELAHQTAIFFWYINDFDNLDQCISWRVNPNHFAVRKTVWDIVDGFDKDFENIQMQALDFGFQTLRFFGGVPLYIKGLFETNDFEQIKVSRKDKYTFYIKNFKVRHTIFMLYRLGFWKIWEVKSFLEAKKKYKKRNFNTIIPPRKLVEIDEVSVSYIIPTMFRQDFTLQLLDDLALQNLKPTQVIIVDATPESERNESLYGLKQYPFELNVIWQTSKGSCRARNEAIEISKGEYIVFGDDDIRIPNDFIENHIKFLKTYQSDACNGLDIRANHHTQDLNDLNFKLDNFGEFRYKTGVACSFSNANSCVKREFVNMLGGNDVNFDGGYGEDGDFGLSLAKIGVTVMFNPFSTNLHLKPPSGGYRWWGSQASLLGKKRKQQPWELDSPVRSIKPVPSPTVMYGILKQFTPQQLEEYKHKHFSYYLFTGSKIGFLYRFLRIPYKNLQFKKSVFYAENLMKLGVRNK
jgi:glycosyltransferase involved in cell wall biosynthesis